MSGERASLSLTKKCEIYEEVDEQKTRKAEIAQQHGIRKSLFFSILKMREEIFATHDSWRFRRSFAKMIRPDEIAKPACKWPMVQKKADELALSAPRNIVGESASVKPKLVSEGLPLLQNILSRYQPRNVYNADELGMFYNLMPDHTLAVKGDVCKGTKRSKERLTVLQHGRQ
ncbi:hypothetical protein PR048_029475 [Dryococelus australis]|uniref:Uncharacterized protein n=1 Tax=Dryococelus australis TaxID=614101 RepID=A0ABQ9GDU7_9NEOP|nr:hypothetical protein PR048_029475 [Dryococelus australis]